MANGLPDFLVNPKDEPAVTPVNHTRVPANEQSVPQITNPFFKPDAPPIIVPANQRPSETSQPPPAPEAPPVVMVPLNQPAPEATPVQVAANPSIVNEAAQTQTPIRPGVEAMPDVQQLTEQAPMPIRPGVENMPPISNPAPAPNFQPITNPPAENNTPAGLPPREDDPSRSYIVSLEEKKRRDEAELAELQAQLAAQNPKNIKDFVAFKKQKDAAAQVNQPPAPDPTPKMTAQPITDTFKALAQQQAIQAALHGDTAQVPTIDKNANTFPGEEELLVNPEDETELTLEMRHAKFQELYDQLAAIDISELSEFSQMRVRRILEKFRNKIDAARKATTEVEAIARIASGVRLILRAQSAVLALDALVNVKDDKPAESNNNLSMETPEITNAPANNNNEPPVPSSDSAENTTTANDESSQNAEQADETQSNENTENGDSNVSDQNNDNNGANGEPLTAEKVAQLLAPLQDKTTEEKQAA